MSSTSLSLAPVRSIRSIRSISTTRTAAATTTTRTPWRHVSSSFLEGSNRPRVPPLRPTTRWTFDYHCRRCLSTTRTLLAETPHPLVTPKISKYRVDCNTSKVIKRRKKGNEDGKKAIPNVVRSKPVANPKKARQAAEAATRENARNRGEAEASAAAAAGKGAPPSATTLAPPPKSLASFHVRKPSPLKPELSTSTSTATNTQYSTTEPSAKEPAPRTSEAVVPQLPLPSPTLPHARRIPADQPLPDLDAVLSTLAEAIATQPAPISSGWNTRSPLQSYRLPLPELTDQSEERHPTLDPLPKMATSIERRPSQAPQRIKRSVYRTILDWSVHPTIQPNDFNTLSDLTQIAPPRAAHPVKSTPFTNVAATSGRSERITNTSVASTSTSTNATAPSTSDEGVVKKRYVSRRRIGFDDDDDLDFKLRPYHSGQSTTQVLDTIVHNRINKSTNTQVNPWDISTIRRQKFVPNSENVPKSVLLKNPVIARDLEEREAEEAAKVTASTTTAPKPSQSALPWRKIEHGDLTQQSAIVLPDQPLLGSWIDSPSKEPEKKADSKDKSTYGEYLFSPKSVLPALRTGLRKPYELLYTDCNIHPRISQMVLECVETASEMGLGVIKTTPERLDTLLGHKYHQGVLLRASYLPRALIKYLGAVSEDNKYDLHFIRGTAKPFDRLTTTSNTTHMITSGIASTKTPRASSPPVWLVLDEVQTVYDMGHILSTAHHLGIDGVIIKEKGAVLPHAAVSAVSEGTLERRPAYAVRTLVKFIKESQANGWQVIGLKAAYGSKRLVPFYKFPKHGVDQPTILIVGGSGVGISKSAERQCDSFIHVPGLSHMAMAFGEVASLPVPVISGIAISKLVGGRMAAAAGSDGSDKKTGGAEGFDSENDGPIPWVGGLPEWEVPMLKSKGKGNQISHTRNDIRR